LKKFDSEGNRLYSCTINTIAPIALADNARAIAVKFLTDLKIEEKDPLPTKLKDIQSNEITHVFCSRKASTRELGNQMWFMQNYSEEWISGKLETDPERIKKLFCTVVADKADLLQALGLEEHGN